MPRTTPIESLVGSNNLLSGISFGSGPGIPAFRLDVGVDLDAHGADEAQKRVFAGKDAHLHHAPFQPCGTARSIGFELPAPGDGR